MPLAEKDKRRFYGAVLEGPRRKCWTWKLSLSKQSGYGQFKLNGVKEHAHRVAFFLANGYLPEVVRHKCDNRKCVNPNHLLPGTNLENVQDRVERGRSAFGERAGCAKLTESIVREIRASDAPHSTLATIYGVSDTTIIRARGGQTWRHVS